MSFGGLQKRRENEKEYFVLIFILVRSRSAFFQRCIKMYPKYVCSEHEVLAMYVRKQSKAQTIQIALKLVNKFK
jgi:hypothetical protein